ncbi:MAG: PKD domain-containing protein [Limnochordia bacterium]|jgi:hypothetical protein
MNRARRTFAGSLTLAMLILLTLGSVAMAQSEVPPWESETAAPQGAPDSDFVKQMQELFGEQQGAAPSTGDASTRRMVVQGITPTPESVSVWTDGRAYTIGSDVRISFRLSRAAYAYILNVDTRGNIRLVFPNNWDRESYMSQAGTHNLPRGRYTFRVEGPVGREYLLLIASNQRISFLERLVSSGGDFPLMGSAASTLKQFQDWVRDTRSWSAFAWSAYDVEAGRDSWLIPRLQPPVARIQASATEVELGTSISFSARGSYAPTGTIRSYRWDFDDDGRTDASGESARWTYNRPGTYTARLTVEDNRGTTASATVRIVVKEQKVLVEITSRPSERQVYIDGSYVGRTKLKHYLTPGSHEVRVAGPSGQDFTGVVNIPSGLRSIELAISF